MQNMNIDNSVAERLIRLSLLFCSHDPFRADWMDRFRKELVSIASPFTDAWYRAAFFEGLAQFGPGISWDFPDDIRLAKSDRLRPALPILVQMAGVRALVESGTIQSSMKSDQPITSMSLDWVLKRLDDIISFDPSTFTPLAVFRKGEEVYAVASNVQYRYHSMFLYNWIRKSLSPSNTHRYECQIRMGSNKYASFFSEWELNGPFPLGLNLPVREYGAYQHQEKIVNFMIGMRTDFTAPSRNQMFAKVHASLENLQKAMEKAPTIVDDVQETVAASKVVVNKVDEMVNDLSSSVRENADTIRQTAEAVNTAMPLLERMEQLLTPVFSAISGISATMSKVAEAFKKLFKFAMRFAYVTFPLIFCVLVVLLRPWIPLALAKTIFGIAGIVGLVILGVSINTDWHRLMTRLQAYWDQREEREDEGFGDTADEDLLVDANLHADNADHAGIRNVTKILRLRDDIPDDLGIDYDSPKFSPPPPTSWASALEAPSVEQAGNDFVTLLASVYCGLGVDVTKKSEVIAAIKAIPSVSKGAEALMGAISNFFMVIMQSCANYFGLQTEFAMALDDRYHNWMDKTNSYLSKEKSFTLDVSERGYRDLEAHVLNGLELAQTFEDAQQKTLGTLMAKHVYALQILLAKVDSMRITEPKDRAEPLCALFQGDPGHGKSTAISLIADACVRDELKTSPALLDLYERTPQQFIHQRSSEKWFEGYNPNTVAMVHDEFPLTKETTPDDSKLVGLIDEVNITSKALPMANAELKGKMYYNHKYTFLTSNATDYSSQLLVSQGALARRIHLVIKVESVGDIPNAKRGTTIDPDNWRFVLCRQVGDIRYEPTAVSMNLKMVITFLIGMKERREMMRQTNERVKRGLVNGLISQPQAGLISDAISSFKEVNGRVPDNEEMFTYINENKELFTNLGYDMSQYDTKKKTKTNEKESVTDVLDRAFSKVSVNQADQTYADVMGFEVGDVGALYKCIASPDLTAEQRGFLQVLGWQLQARVQTMQFPTRLKEGTSMDVSANLKSEINTTSKVKWMQWGLQVIIAVASTCDPMNVFNELEALFAVLCTYGKYHIFGYRIPMVEPYIDYKMINGISTMGNAAKITLQATDRGRPTTLVSLFASFMRKIGLDYVFGLTSTVAADWYCNEFDMIEYAASTGKNFVQTNYNTMRNYLASVFELYRKCNRGEITYLEAANIAKSLIVVDVTKYFDDTKASLVEYYNNIKNKLYLVARDAYCWLLKYGPLLIASLAGLIAGTAYFINMPGHYFFASAFTQDSSTRTEKYMNRGYSSRARNRWAKSRVGTQNQETLHWLDNVVPVVRRNMYNLISPSGIKCGTILFIERKRAIVLWHYFVTAERWQDENPYPDKAFFHIENDGKKYSIQASQICVVRDLDKEYKDGMLVDLLHPDLPLHKDISKHFIDPKEHDMEMLKGSFKIAFVSKELVYVNDAAMMRIAPGVAVADAKILSEVTVVGMEEPRLNCIGYLIPTKDGDCGNVIFYKGKICGIHAHGNGSTGQATRWDKSMLKEYYAEPADVEAEPATMFSDNDFDFSGVYENQAYDDSCRSPVKIGIANPPMNTFVKQWYVEWNPDDPLKPVKVPCNPVVKNYSAARSKYGFHEAKWDTQVMDFCGLVYGDHIIKRPNSEVIKRLLTAEEAIRGIPSTSVRPLDQTTSPGFPFNYFHEPRSKVYRIEEDGKMTKGSNWDSFIADASLSVKFMSTGVSPVYIFTDAEKYELRKVEKVDQPRLISGAPLEHTVLCRVFFGGFGAHVADTWMFGDTLIGIDPHHDADFLERRFLAIGDSERECTGDFSGYDGVCTAEIIEVLVKIVNRWYGDREESGPARVRQSLARSCVIGGHLFDKYVDLWPGGWASGAYMTALFNSMRNTILNMYSCAITAKQMGMNWREITVEFFDNVMIRTLGDDLRFAVTKKYAFHNNLSMFIVMRDHFDMTYTSAAKGTVQDAFDKKENRSLLKRNAVFCEEDGVYYWALDLATIKDMCCYTKKGKEVEVMQQRIDNARRELSFHPPEIWDEWEPVLMRKAGPLYKSSGLSQYDTRQMALGDWNRF